MSIPSVFLLTIMSASLSLSVASSGLPVASSGLPATYAWETNPIMKHVDRSGWLKLRDLHQDVKDNSCDSNICILLEVSNAVSDEELEDQKNFADLIIAITTTDSGGNFCGAIHSRRSTPFYALSGDKLGFLEKLHNVQKPPPTPQRGVGSSNLLSALRYGIQQLIHHGDDSNKIIVFSKSEPMLPFSYANFLIEQFHDKHGIVCAVALDEEHKSDLALLTGDENKVVSIKGFFDLAEIMVATVADVCSLPCETRYGARGVDSTGVVKKVSPMRACPNGSTE